MAPASVVKYKQPIHFYITFPIILELRFKKIYISLHSNKKKNPMIHIQRHIPVEVNRPDDVMAVHTDRMRWGRSDHGLGSKVHFAF